MPKHAIVDADSALLAPGLEYEVVSLHGLHAAELLAYASSIARNNDSARDGVQEAFLRYFVERSYGRNIQNPRAWLYRVVHNHLLDVRDEAAARYEVQSGDVGNIPDGLPGPEAALGHAEAAQAIVALLTRREMECLRLRAESLAYEEIASILGIRAGTVSALLTRAHMKLRDAVGNTGSQRMGVAEALLYLVRGRKSYSP